MPTTIHISEPLLVAVNRKAKALNISRNRLIVQALEREVTQGSDWSPDFFTRLSAGGPDIAAAADELLGHIRGQRRSKRAVQL